MDVMLWAIVVYFGSGVVWLAVILVLARIDYQTISIKEALIHLLAWPYVLVSARVWWAVIAVAMIVAWATFWLFIRSR